MTSLGRNGREDAAIAHVFRLMEVFRALGVHLDLSFVRWEWRLFFEVLNFSFLPDFVCYEFAGTRTIYVSSLVSLLIEIYCEIYDRVGYCGKGKSPQNLMSTGATKY